MALAPIIFFVLAIIAIASAVGVLVARSPIYSALSLVMNLLCVAGIYLTMSASFIGVLQILVYAGAIMVLVLFVIMLLNLEAPSMKELSDVGWAPIAGFFLGVIVLAQLLYTILAGLDVPLESEVSAEVAAQTGSAETLGLMLFTEYALHLQVAALLLLAAAIGAVMLAKRHFE